MLAQGDPLTLVPLHYNLSGSHCTLEGHQAPTSFPDAEKVFPDPESRTDHIWIHREEPRVQSEPNSTEPLSPASLPSSLAPELLTAMPRVS